MSLAPGSRLGVYEVIALLGAGGMGEVYRARDTRLDRTVAIKVLPAQFAADPDLRARFEREGRAISSLEHPHICPLYDVGEHQGNTFLVMQHLDGETLEARLKKGALPRDEAVKVATAIADALDKAHRAGIVHRDLKPGNIMLTRSGAKLLDFGLAKSGVAAGSGPGLSMMPTTPPNVTVQGSILGTFHYMSPEQLEGGDADPRSDIFGFGLVLYEMLTGLRAFDGRSQASLIGAILKDPAPAIAGEPFIDHVVQRCLAKDPDARWQNAGDVMRELQWVAQQVPERGIPVTSHRSRVRERLGWTIAAACVVLGVLGGVFVFLNRPSPDPRVVRFTIAPPDGWRLDAYPTGVPLAISPDSRMLAFVATQTAASASQMLWVRPLDSTAARMLPGTEGASGPFWSPDSRFLGFFADRKLKKIEVNGGMPIALADAPQHRGGAWSAGGVIVFATTASPGLLKVPAAGGSAVPATTITETERGHGRPVFIDERRFIHGALFRDPQVPRKVYIASLETTERSEIATNEPVSMLYSRGHAVFLQGAALVARPLDVRTAERAGEAILLADGVHSLPGTTPPMGVYAVSDNVLAYQPRQSIANQQLKWFDRGGKLLKTLGEPGTYSSVDLAPNGAAVAASLLDAARETRDIWMYDVALGIPSRLTFFPEEERSAVFSPDSTRVAFNLGRPGAFVLREKAADGSGTDVTLLDDPASKDPNSYSPDGRYLLYRLSTPTGNDLWVLPMLGDRKPFPFLATPFDENYARFSPDGRWVAYTPDESGQPEVYVAAFPGPGGKWQVSTQGGAFPRWRGDGRELFYIGADNNLTTTAVDARGAAVTLGETRTLFRVHTPIQPGYPYAVSADGQRFVVINDVTVPAPISIVLNWAAALQSRD